MSEQTGSGAAPEWVDRFLDALAAHPTVQGAAAATGVPISSAYAQRRRNVHFLQAWEARRRGVPREDALSRMPATDRFDRFLELLAETSNVRAAAGAAGIATSAIYTLRRTDPAFARRWYAALAEGYDNLEMELLGRLRGGEGAEAGGAAPAEGMAPAKKFDTATALRCLTAHRESVAREKGRRTLAAELVTIAAINARIDEMRLKQVVTRKAVARVRKARAEHAVKAAPGRA